MAGTVIQDGALRRVSRNLRGLVDHALRVGNRRKDCVGSYGSVSAVYVDSRRGVNGHAVTVHYTDGSVGMSTFACFTVAHRWAEAFVARRGGDVRVGG